MRNLSGERKPVKTLQSHKFACIKVLLLKERISRYSRVYSAHFLLLLSRPGAACFIQGDFSSGVTCVLCISHLSTYLYGMARLGIHKTRLPGSSMLRALANQQQVAYLLRSVYYNCIYRSLSSMQSRLMQSHSKILFQRYTWRFTYIAYMTRNLGMQPKLICACN